MASYPKHINHELSAMTCPVALGDVDLFGKGAQEHWYEAYEILHREAPVLRIEGGGFKPGTDAFVLTKHADVTRVVKDPERFPRRCWAILFRALRRHSARHLREICFV